jgi:hypothetical protein
MKYKSLILTLLFILVITLVSSCDYYNHKLKLHNKSKEIITVEYADRELPDEMNYVEFYIADYNVIMPDSTKDIVTGGKEDAWHFYIDHSPRKKLFVYVFSVKQISQYRGNVMVDIIRAGKYLKRFEYTEQELISRNWVIDYEQEK